MKINSPSFNKLENLLNKTRIHFYKPIQIAEILYKSRTKSDIDLNDLDPQFNKIELPGFETDPARMACCKICKKGKACGDTCINKSYTCTKPRGCACNG